MTRKILYVLNIPEGSQMRTRKEMQRNVSKQGVMQGGAANVEDVSVEPGSRSLQGEYRGELSDVMGLEVEELFGCGGISYVPMFGVDADGNRVTTENDGYYSLENVTLNPADPRNDTRGHYQFDGQVTKKGTKQDYWRAVKTDPKIVDNEYGSDQTAYVGIPSTASKLRWFDNHGGSGQRTSATVVETRSTEFGDVDIIDAQEPGFDKPMAIYEIAYEDEGKTDPGVWDTRGVSKTRSVDGNDVCQWARVFDTAHEYTGNLVVDNGIVRIEFNEGNRAMSARRWDGTNGQWIDDTVANTSWELFDIDVFEIGDERVRGQVEFHDTNDGSYYSLDMALRRGYDDIQWTIPENQGGGVPQGLLDMLQFISHDSVVSPDETKTLKERKGVRR